MTRRIGLLHLAPVLGDLKENRKLLERSTELAAGAGADWVVSGELVVAGYEFEPVIGTEWIQPQPDQWLTAYGALVRFPRSMRLRASTGTRSK